MNILTDPNHLKNLFRSLHLKPKDYMGQNFLVSEEVVDEILSIAEIEKTDIVVEIGPGLGVMTYELAKKSKKVIAIEKDKIFAAILKRNAELDSASHSRDPETSSGLHNVEIVNEDVLKFNFEKIQGPYKIVANIPYYLTSHLIQILLAQKNKPSRMVLMVQKEVGERLVAEAGELSLLGISVQAFADVAIAALVPKKNFWPQPQVDSCVVVIEPKQKLPEGIDQNLFFRLLKIAFAGKRKQIHNTLANGFKLPSSEIENILHEAKIDAKARPQELRIEDWVRLCKEFKKKKV